LQGWGREREGGSELGKDKISPLVEMYTYNILFYKMIVFATVFFVSIIIPVIKNIVSVQWGMLIANSNHPILLSQYKIFHLLQFFSISLS
jgi:hypothetical protein